MAAPWSPPSAESTARRSPATSVPVEYGHEGHRPIFKWPHRFKPTLELMLGAGPTIAAAKGYSWGFEAAIDVMYWPNGFVGVWVEPTFDLFLSGVASNSFGATAGPWLDGDPSGKSRVKVSCTRQGEARYAAGFDLGCQPAFESVPISKRLAVPVQEHE